MIKDKVRLISWLEKTKWNYHINYDLSVDIVGDVKLNNFFDFLPIQFGVITGNFDCSQTYILSLKGSPYEVSGNFNCSKNRLTNLDYAPQHVGKNFLCHQNEIQIESELNIQCERFIQTIDKKTQTIELLKDLYLIENNTDEYFKASINIPSEILNYRTQYLKQTSSDLLGPLNLETLENLDNKYTNNNINNNTHAKHKY